MTSQQGFKLGPQHSGWLEAAIDLKILRERAVQCAGDMAGCRVKRLDFAPKTRCAPRIKQGLGWFAQVFNYGFSSCQRNTSNG